LTFESHRIYPGDCLELFAQVADGAFDCVLTDPPWPGCKIDIGWKGPAWWRKVIVEMERVVGSRGKIILHINSETDPRVMLKPFKLPFIHQGVLRFIPPRFRGNVCNEFDVFYEFGYGFLPKGRTVLTQRCDSAPSRGSSEKRPDFPCYRNLGHVKWLVKTQVGPGRTILDPFAGSGTTLVAAIRESTGAVGFELNAEVCQKANERVQHALNGVKRKDPKGQEVMFA
jgi:16S rRNA G966 N2-methylase RsmD